jgi:Holliday junction resolvase RusA-like endonuclease
MKHIGRGRMIASNKKALDAWRADVALAVYEEWLRLGDVVKFDCAVGVEIKFCVRRPAAAKKRKHPTTPYDLDKLCRAIGDGISVNIDLVANDSQICELRAVKVFADDCMFGAHVTVTELL